MSRWTLFIVLQVVVIGLDRITKVLAREHLQGAGRLSYLGDTVRLQYSENTGAFLSLGANLAPDTRFLVITGLSALLLVGLFLALVTMRDLTRGEFLLLSLILAGGVANLIDRISNDGRVEDFLNVGIGGVRTGIFNIADMAITGGVLMAVFLILFRREGDKPDEEQASPTTQKE